MKEDKLPLVILTGPTAVGKTKLSIAFAKAVGGEIISADSMQVYKHMDIGSAKIRPEEMGGVPHFLIDMLETTDEFNAFHFKQYAERYIREICGRGHIPVLVGGTGFYIQAVLYDIDFDAQEEKEGPGLEKDELLRRKLEEIAASKGKEYLHGMLREVDEEAAMQIHCNNVRRVARALAFYIQTGEKLSAHNEKQRRKGPAYNSAYFVLDDNRKHLYDRIDKRVDRMLADGLVEEVRGLKELGCDADMVSMKGLGYKEILGYLNGEYDLEQAVYLIKRDTRHFAKRQLTWFRREKDVIWVNKEEFCYEEDRILEFLIAKCREKGVLRK